MRVLVLDAGNTNLKVAIIEDGKLKQFISSNYSFAEKLKVPDYDMGIIVSTVKDLNGFISRIFKKTFILKPQDLKIKSQYSLDLVGADRIAASYPFIKHGKDAILVISGTSITINVIKGGIFYGGPIFPPFSGIVSSYRILAIRRFGEDTQRAISSAINDMFLGGIIYSINRLSEEFEISDILVSSGFPYKIPKSKVINYPVIFGAYEILLDTTVQ